VEGGRVLRLKDNPASGPYLKPCPRGYLLHRAHYAPDRLLAPLIASGPKGSGLFRKASWDEALDLAASRLSGLWKRHGLSSLLALGSTGSTGALHDSGALLARFLNAARGSTDHAAASPGAAASADISANKAAGGRGQSACFLSSNYSNGAARFVLPYLYGEAHRESGFDASSARHAKLIVLWGANILEARLGSELGARVAEAAKAGTPVIAIDPRRSVTAAALGARWIGIRPGSDAALMLALLHEFYSGGSVNEARVSELSEGMEGLAAYVLGRVDGRPRDAAWAEAITGVPAAITRQLAEAWMSARPTMLIPGYSIQRTRAGEESYRLSAALQLACGSFGMKGGSTGSINNRLPKPRVGAISDLARGDEVSVPVLRWPDAILKGRRGGYPADIKAAYFSGCNFANQGADSNKSRRALLSLEFSLCHELFLTPSAALCDIVLPASSPLEKEDIGLPWDGSYLLYKPKAVEHEGQARDDYRIFAELAARLGFGQRFDEGRDAGAWIEGFLRDSEIQDIGAFKESGIYRADFPERSGLDAFVADPKGRPLPTPSGRVEIRSEAYARDTGGSALPLWEDAPQDTDLPFLLISPKTLRRTHSQNGGGQSWSGLRADLGEATLNEGDAERLGVAEGERVRIYNENGATEARAKLSADIVGGVVCLHEGAWFAPGPDGVDSAGSANALTGTEGTGPALGPVMHGVPVGMIKAAAP
jgi:anaerobic dimethyl sulfoxide reductase subunit A